jgi:hypothetical protein
MATNKKKTKKKLMAKKTVGRKGKPTKKQTKNAATKSAKRTSAPKRAAAKKKSAKNATTGKTASASNRETRNRTQGRRLAFSRETLGPRSGEQSGDLQGLSDVERADSESVDELIEEGNAFEAGVVAGVEDAEEHGEREVRTHEVPEDDVPEEYLDKD